MDDLKELKSIKYDNCKIILYEIPLKIIFNRNIICQDLQGCTIWQIEDIYKDSNIPQDSPFVNIKYYDKDKIIAYNFNGGQYYISVKTGEIELIYKMRY